jgi:hypothetical protein
MEQKFSPGEDSSFVLSSLGDPVKKRQMLNETIHNSAFTIHNLSSPNEHRHSSVSPEQTPPM